MKRSILFSASLAALMTATALSGCATSGSSSASSMFGMRSNFQSAHESFEGRFVHTIDMASVGENQSTLSNADMIELALRGDPNSRRGFYGQVHASLFEAEAVHRHLVSDPAAEAYLTGIRDELLAAWDGPAPSVGIVISADPSLRGLSYRNNFIVVPYGLLISAESDDEVAALMAHELSHLLLGHHTAKDAAAGEEEASAAIDTIGLYSATARMTRARQTADGGVEFYTVQDAEAESMLQHVHISTQLTREISRTFLFPSLNREQEDHADLLGIDLMAGAGYNPAAMVELLERTASQVEEAESNTERLSDQERAAAARAAEALGLVDTNNPLQRLGLNVGMEVYGEIRARARSQYRSFEQRTENAGLYARREYIQDMGAGYRSDGLERLRGSRSGSLIAAYQAAFEAEDLFSGFTDETIGAQVRQMRLQEALARSQAAINSGGHAQSYIRFQRFQLLKAAKQPSAFDELRTAADLPTASAQVFEVYARELLDRRRAQEADTAMDRGEALLGTGLNFLDMRLEADAMRGRVEDALAHYEECQSVAHDGLKRTCQQVAVEYGIIAQTETLNPFDLPNLFSAGQQS